MIAGLQEGRPARDFPPPADAPDAVQNLQPLTAKPVLYVANVGEDATLEAPPELAARGAALAVSARIESELAELDEEEAAAMREDLGVTRVGARRGSSRAPSSCSG